jgi:hypothetical protein
MAHFGGGKRGARAAPQGSASDRLGVDPAAGWIRGRWRGAFTEVPKYRGPVRI